MPAGANPALARAIGVLLKNAWMQALLRRPAEATRRPGRYLRPAVFICDEYQAFATVGQDDPSGDEKAFALTRQCRCVPIVSHAVDLLAPLRAARRRGLAHAPPDAPHPDLPVAVRRVVGPDRVRDVRERHEDAALLHVHRDHGQARVLRSCPGAQEADVARSARASRSGSRGSPCSRRASSALLANYQAICLPYDGTKSLPARRVYLKPHYLPRDVGLLAAPRGGTDSEARKRNRPPEAVPSGPGDAPRGPGGLRDHDQRTRQRLDRARRPTRVPRGAGTHRRLAPPRRNPHRPAARPRSRRQPHPRCPSRGRLQGRHLHAARESRGRHHHYAGSGGRAFSARGPGAHGLAAGDGPRGRPVGPLGPQEHPGLRRHGLGQDDAPQRADRVAARRRADRPPSRTRSNSGSTARTACASRPELSAPRPPVSIRDLVRHALRHRPDHIVVGEVQGRRGRRSAPGAQHRPRRVADHHPREQRPLRALAPSQLRHAGRRRASLGGHLPGRRRRNRTCAAHGPATGQAVRRGGARSVRPTTRPRAAGSPNRSGAGPTKPRKNSTHTPRR